MSVTWQLGVYIEYLWLVYQLTWATLPIITDCTNFGSTPPAFKAATLATLAISVAVKPFNLPPNVPKGVRLAATMNTALLAAILIDERNNGTKIVGFYPIDSRTLGADRIYAWIV